MFVLGNHCQQLGGEGGDIKSEEINTKPDPKNLCTDPVPGRGVSGSQSLSTRGSEFFSWHCRAALSQPHIQGHHHHKAQDGRPGCQFPVATAGREGTGNVGSRGRCSCPTQAREGMSPRPCPWWLFPGTRATPWLHPDPPGSQIPSPAMGTFPSFPFTLLPGGFPAPPAPLHIPGLGWVFIFPPFPNSLFPWTFLAPRGNFRPAFPFTPRNREIISFPSRGQTEKRDFPLRFLHPSLPRAPSSSGLD